MRQLKFRVWSKVKNGWVHNMLLLACIDGLPFAHLVETDKDGKFAKHHIYNASNLDVVIQQYTGLKDKNGVDIYEGDILSYEGIHKVGDGVSIVSFEDGSFMIDEDFASRDWAAEHKIIGNIVENSELLKA